MPSFPSSIKTFTSVNPDDIITSAGWNDVTAEITAIETGLIGGGLAWASYAVEWNTITSENPAIGNGTLTGRYLKLGDLVFVQINQVMGTTTTYGTTAWQWTLPVTAASVILPSAGGVGYMFDVGTAHHGPYLCYVADSAHVRLINDGNVGSGIVQGLIFTAAATDVFTLGFVYEAA